jgi:YfiR/HmsC-like
VRKFRLIARAFTGMLLLSAAALAGGLVPGALRSAIIVRSAGYERHFNERGGDAVLAVVVGKTGTAADDGRAMAETFSKLLRETRVGTRKARVVTITHENNSRTNEELSNARAEIVYLASGLEGVAATIPAELSGVKRILVCANGADVGVGCTLGVELDGEKSRIVLNLKQANSAGLRFDAGLLRLARIVR